jgi:hypothetical protein
MACFMLKRFRRRVEKQLGCASGAWSPSNPSSSGLAGECFACQKSPTRFLSIQSARRSRWATRYPFTVNQLVAGTAAGSIWCCSPDGSAWNTALVTCTFDHAPTARNAAQLGVPTRNWGSPSYAVRPSFGVGAPGQVSQPVAGSQFEVPKGWGINMTEWQLFVFDGIGGGIL